MAAGKTRTPGPKDRRPVASTRHALGRTNLGEPGASTTEQAKPDRHDRPMQLVRLLRPSYQTDPLLLQELAFEEAVSVRPEMTVLSSVSSAAATWWQPPGRTPGWQTAAAPRRLGR